MSFEIKLVSAPPGTAYWDLVIEDYYNNLWAPVFGDQDIPVTTKTVTSDFPEGSDEMGPPFHTPWERLWARFFDQGVELLDQFFVNWVKLTPGLRFEVDGLKHKILVFYPGQTSGSGRDKNVLIAGGVAMATGALLLARRRK